MEKNTWYIPCKNTSWRLIGDEVLLQNDYHLSHAIAGTGVEIWNLIVECAMSKHDAISELCQRYNLSNSSEITNDVEEFLRELENRQFIVPVTDPPELRQPPKVDDDHMFKEVR